MSNWSWERLVSFTSVLLLLVTYSKGSEVTVNTSSTVGYHYTYTNYSVNDTNTFFFKISGQGGAHIGLFERILSSFQNEAFYEIIIGLYPKWTILRKQGGIGPNKKELQTGYLAHTHANPFWLSWQDNIITLGQGSQIGDEIIFQYNDTAPLAIHHLGLGSNSSSTSYHSWKFYDAEPIPPTPNAECNVKDPLPKLPMNSTAIRDIINDNNDLTCYNISTKLPGIFFPLTIHKKPPLTIKLKMGLISSCDKSKMLVYTGSVAPCSLVSNEVIHGLTTCIFRCSAGNTTKVTLGFLQTWNDQTLASLCEVVPI